MPFNETIFFYKRLREYSNIVPLNVTQKFLSYANQLHQSHVICVILQHKIAMASNNKTIPTSECLEKLKEIYDDLRHKNQKLGSYENVREILQMCGVSVTEKPDEKVRENVHLMYLLKCIRCKNCFFTISN